MVVNKERSRLLITKLRNPVLQQQLIDIDTCRIGSSVEKLESMMRQYPEFARFMDEYLYLIGERDDLPTNPQQQQQ